MGASLDTELSLACVDTELPIMPFPLQPTESDQAAGEMRLLRLRRARLTARQGQLIFADADHFLDLGTPAIQTAHLRGRQRQAMGGVVLLAVSDNQHFEATAEPAALGPVGVPPLMTERAAIEPPMLFETAHDILPILANPLQQGSGGIPGIDQHIVGMTPQAIPGIAE
jgi:hypothetical protein